MKHDKETKKKLLDSAREEFMDKGYQGASLRNICKNAGVTTGALYFFFENKEDLFNALAKDTMQLLYQIVAEHFEHEIVMIEKGLIRLSVQSDFSEDMDVIKKIVKFIFSRKSDFILVLTKSQGTALENMADKFVEFTEKHYMLMAEAMNNEVRDVKVSDTMIHWLAHMQIDSFVYMITHIEDESEAIAYMESNTKYMIYGWYGMWANQSNSHE